MLPLLILGGAAILGGGIGTGLALQDGDTTTNTYQTTNQTNNYTKKVSFSFDNATFEKDSTVNIKDEFKVDSKQSATSKATNDNTKPMIDNKLLLIGGLALVGYMVLGGRK